MEVREKYNVYMKSKRWEFWKAKKRKEKIDTKKYQNGEKIMKIKKNIEI